MSLCVQDVMVRDVVTVDSEYSVKYAARMMNYFGISSLMVLSKGDVVGIITERDVLTRVVAVGQDPEKVMVGEVMSKLVIVVSPTMPLDDAVKIMFQRRIKKLPVVSKKKANSRLIGMLSQRCGAAPAPDGRDDEGAVRHGRPRLGGVSPLLRPLTLSPSQGSALFSPGCRGRCRVPEISK